MRLFRRRDRNDAGPLAGTPFARTAVLYQAGRYAETEAEARSVAAGPFRRRDEVYRQVAMGIAALAVTAQGRHADALAMYDEVFQAAVRDYGSDHRHTLKIRSDRADTLGAVGRDVESEAEFAAVVQLADRATGPDMPFRAAVARAGQAAALDQLGRHPQAEALARQVLATHHEPDLTRLGLRLTLAYTLSGQDRHTEALAEVQRADVLCRNLSQGDSRPATGAVDKAAAMVLFGLGRTAEARPRAVAAYDARLALFGPDHYGTCSAKALLDRIDGA
ncbi:tetratricopeptide repeat protein [Streptomyces sp. NPDC002886]|uniref:tetratricopeptide repeat protein n=1 Tax=Streptomyces sp. NPDC002886 TaxID=3364667 RepID=UPI0036791481